MLKKGREDRSWTEYRWWWEQEGIDLEGTRVASGVAEAELEEGDAEDRGGVGCGEGGG